MASIYSTYKLFAVVIPSMKMAHLCDIKNSVMMMTTISLRTGKAHFILCHREINVFIYQLQYCPV